MGVIYHVAEGYSPLNSYTNPLFLKMKWAIVFRVITNRIIIRLSLLIKVSFLHLTAALKYEILKRWIRHTRDHALYVFSYTKTIWQMQSNTCTQIIGTSRWVDVKSIYALCDDNPTICTTPDGIVHRSVWEWIHVLRKSGQRYQCLCNYCCQ